MGESDGKELGAGRDETARGTSELIELHRQEWLTTRDQSIKSDRHTGGVPFYKATKKKLF